jgi:hypothetical protein
MNAEREVHEDDLTAEPLEEIYGNQAEGDVEQERQDGEPVADDERLDTDLIDRQLADRAEDDADD